MPFADVTGHRRQIDVLQRLASSGRLAHAILLRPPAGGADERVGT